MMFMRVERRTMIPMVGQTVTITGPNGSPQHGRILNVYRSTGGFLSIWIELHDCFANPANDVAGACMSRALVLTESGGVHRDLWHR